MNKINNTYTNRAKNVYLFSIIIIAFLSSCKDYLDIKPDKQLVVPSSLQDCQALLDSYPVMNTTYPVEGEVAADNYYLTDVTWNALPQLFAKDNYIWKPDAEMNQNSWFGSYQAILNANLVLETLQKIKITSSNQLEYNSIKGGALFYRGYAFHQLSQIFAPPYDSNNDGTGAGVPLRLTSDISEKTVRSSVKQTYSQIIDDLTKASELLPLTSSIPSSPSRTAALSALARVYLSMADYNQAGIFADLCLKQYNTLLDYKNLNVASPTPFSRFNAEVIFHSMSIAGLGLQPTRGKIDSALILLYNENDLRKKLFFRLNSDGKTYQFKGSYDGTNFGSLFTGLTTSEMYLIRAECYARAGKLELALVDLNDLLRNRSGVPFIPISTSNSGEALEVILRERRKELIYRCLRWSDLRRLNKESKFATTLRRNLNGQVYLLSPEDSRYVLLIPREVLNRVDIPQNPR